MIINKQKLIAITPLVLIITLGILLRVISLNTSPPGFNADEAAFGYNAYSILKTGMDEYGEPFPIVFKSFSDYKPSPPVYMTIPFVAIFGLNEFATRLPSLILGILSIIVIYFLSKEIFKKESIALSTAFLLAISPWHIHYSRGAWETNIATFFMSVGILFLLYGFKRTNYLYISAIAFILSIYSYQSSRLIIPVFLLLFAVVYHKELFTKRIPFIQKKIVGPLVLAFFLSLPLLVLMTGDKGLARFKGVSMFNDPGPIMRLEELRAEHITPGVFSHFYHNKVFAYGMNYISHYLGNFDPNYLFVQGDELNRNKTPDMGQLYLFELITVMFGVYLLIRGKYKNANVVLFWVIAAPVAAAMTLQTSYALRAHNMVIPLTLISGLGLGWIVMKVVEQKRIVRTISFIFLAAIFSFFFIRYLDLYYLHAPKQYGLEWEYGFSELVPFVYQEKDKYEKVMVTDRYDQPYIMFLFYGKVEPSVYQGKFDVSGIDKFGFSTVTKFDKFEFRTVEKDELLEAKNILYVISGEKDSEGLNVIKTIYFPNGKPAFKVIAT